MGEMIFEVGATVSLRSGGPLMTITNNNGLNEKGEQTWGVAWFDIGDQMHMRSLTERALVREEPKEGAQS